MSRALSRRSTFIWILFYFYRFYHFTIYHCDINYRHFGFLKSWFYVSQVRMFLSRLAFPRCVWLYFCLVISTCLILSKKWKTIDYVHNLSFKDLFLLFNLCGYICIHMHVYVVPMEARRRASESQKQLWASCLGVLELN